jgi:hypothetical protein
MNGSKKMFYKVSLCFICLLGSTSLIFAEEQNDNMPSIEFLEFLGEWETDEGDWVDPATLESEEIGELIKTIEADNEK